MKDPGHRRLGSGNQEKRAQVHQCGMWTQKRQEMGEILAAEDKEVAGKCPQQH